MAAPAHPQQSLRRKPTSALVRLGETIVSGTVRPFPSHNIDAMVAKAGGRVVYRKWTGPEAREKYQHSPPLFILAEPQAPAA